MTSLALGPSPREQFCPDRTRPGAIRRAASSMPGAAPAWTGPAARKLGADASPGFEIAWTKGTTAPSYCNEYA